MPESFAETLTEDHRRCDRLLARVETIANGGDWDRIAVEALGLHGATERHFAFEEDVLFPALESSAPTAAGPTGVMRAEHRQIRQLLAELEQAVEARDADECLGVLETLHLVSQQHNTKEEAILYRMADQVIGPRAEELLDALKD
jgi:hemerythrin-like domain-containing protein